MISSWVLGACGFALAGMLVVPSGRSDAGPSLYGAGRNVGLIYVRSDDSGDAGSAPPDDWVEWYADGPCYFPDEPDTSFVALQVRRELARTVNSREALARGWNPPEDIIVQSAGPTAFADPGRYASMIAYFRCQSIAFDGLAFIVDRSTGATLELGPVLSDRPSEYWKKVGDEWVYYPR